MTDQSFIEPVPNIVEALSRSARKAVEISTKEIDVNLEVHYTGLQVCARRRQYRHNILISWLDLSKYPNPYDIIEKTIDECVECVNNRIKEDIHAASQRRIAP